MAAGGASQSSLPLGGASWVLAVEEVERRFRAAAPGDLIVYAQGPELLRGETSRYVHRLYEAGLADLRQPRFSYGFDFIVRKRPGNAVGLARVANDEDEALETILRQLKREANLGLRCSSDTELAKVAKLPTRNAAAWRITKLKKAGIIRTSVEDGPDGPWRIVTIVETKKQTLLPPALRAVRRSVRQVEAEDEPGKFPPRHGEGPGGLPGRRRWE